MAKNLGVFTRRLGVLTLLTVISLNGLAHEANAQSKVSETMMSRAQKIAKSSVSQADLDKAYSSGQKIKSVAGEPSGKKFAKTCSDLYRATSKSAGLNALKPSHSLIMAQCAGFNS